MLSAVGLPPPTTQPAHPPRSVLADADARAARLPNGKRLLHLHDVRRAAQPGNIVLASEREPSTGLGILRDVVNADDRRACAVRDSLR